MVIFRQSNVTIRQGLVLVGVLATVAQAEQPARTDTPRATSAWKFTAGLAIQESYDSNVFQQDATGDPIVSGAARPGVASLVTSTTLSTDLEYRRGSAFLLTAGYARERAYYDAAASENHAVHRVVLNLSGNAGGVFWRFHNNGTWFDGSDEALAFAAPGGLPAMGGAALRDRRDGFVERSSFTLTVPWGRWFVRPVAASYVHNPLTRQNRRPCYTNYIDRDELIGGLDVGYLLGEKLRWVAGFRSGWQNQRKLHGIDSPFDCVVRRIVAGLEGTPAKWLTINLLAGPETHRFATGTPAGFNRNKSLLWIDASATVIPGPRDVCLIALRRFSQPSSTSLSVYEDISGEVSWRHAFGDKVSTRLGYKIARGDWQAPAWREDRLFTPNMMLRHAIGPRFSYEVSYSFDRGISRVPATAGRDFHRHSGSLLTSYKF